jgi:hypothetical protein
MVTVSVEDMVMLDPIVTLAYHHIMHEGTSLRLRAPEVVEAELRRLRGTPRAATAVLGLVALAAHLEVDLGASAVASAVLAMAARAAGAAEDALGAVHDARADRAQAARARLAAFNDRARPALRRAASTSGGMRLSAVHVPTVFR